MNCQIVTYRRLLEAGHAELIDYLHNSEAIVVEKGPDSMDGWFFETNAI